MIKEAATTVIILSAGAHADLSAGVSIVELVAYLTGSDPAERPTCLHPIVHDILLAAGDQLPDHARQGLLEYLPWLLDAHRDISGTAQAHMVITLLRSQMLPATRALIESTARAVAAHACGVRVDEPLAAASTRLARMSDVPDAPEPVYHHTACCVVLLTRLRSGTVDELGHPFASAVQHLLLAVTNPSDLVGLLLTTLTALGDVSRDPVRTLTPDPQLMADLATLQQHRLIGELP